MCSNDLQVRREELVSYMRENCRDKFSANKSGFKVFYVNLFSGPDTLQHGSRPLINVFGAIDEKFTRGFVDFHLVTHEVAYIFNQSP